jgi:hypothetical protein
MRRGIPTERVGFSLYAGVATESHQRNKLECVLPRSFTRSPLMPALENRLYQFKGHNAELLAQREAILAELHRTIRIHSRPLQASYFDVEKLARVLPDGGFRIDIQSHSAAPSAKLSALTQTVQDFSSPSLRGFEIRSSNSGWIVIDLHGELSDHSAPLLRGRGSAPEFAYCFFSR